MADAILSSGVDIAPGAWAEGVQSAEFKTLIDAKQRSIVPMIVIYMIGYMGLSVLAGFGRSILGIKVLGPVNLGFVLIAGNYIMSWALAVVYARISANATILWSRSSSIKRAPGEPLMNLVTIGMFAAILAISLGITAWAARRTRTTADFYAAGKGLTAAQNGFALAGDWCSAAAFLGFTGLTALYGMDGALYAVGPLVAFCTVLLLIAEPLRNTGTYTIGDVIMYRMRQPPALAAAIVGTIVINLAYLVPQMAGGRRLDQASIRDSL